MQASSPLHIDGIDYLEFYSGNARQAAYHYQRAFGFKPLAYAGLETGVRDRASYVLGQGSIRLVLTSPLSGTHAIAKHVCQHGDGVHDIAFTVPDVEACYHEALRRGAWPAQEPKTFEDDNGIVRRAAVSTYGDTIHSFVERHGYRGRFLPGYVPINGHSVSDGIGLEHIDHVVGNVEAGKLDQWVEFYEQVFGFSQFVSFDDKDISTEYSALRSVVIRDSSGTVTLPINEPARGRSKSQIQEYLDYYGSPGVQHVALRTEGIIPAVRTMRRRGVEFLGVPPVYYENLAERVGRIDESYNDLRRLHILADRDDKGYLLQIFTRPMQDRPTLFFEVIQRAGSESFGKGNFKALFEAIEREQALRGNL